MEIAMTRKLRNLVLLLLGSFGVGLNMYAASTNCSISGTICTIAGNGTGGYTGNGGQATSAEIQNPQGVALDASGNLYIADGSSNVISKITPWGIITTVAGTGTAGYNGDSILATSAELNSPTAVAFDAAGNMYIADTIGERIRKVALVTGLITTIAGTGTQGYSGDGGAATSAELSYPEAVKLDASGNIYFSDSRNQRIRKVTVSTGIITTVAGDGTGGYSGDGGAATSAELDNPYGMVLDASANIYIADSGNNRIRKVNASSGVITTIAGTGAVGYTGNGGLATSATLNFPETLAIDSAGNLYISDFDNYVVRELVASTGIINTVAGDGIGGFSGDGGPATSAELAGAGGLAVDAASDLYIADTLNNRVRLAIAIAPPSSCSAPGTICTIAGNGTAGYTGDGGQAVGAEIKYPQGVGLDGSGNLYIADGSLNIIRKVTPWGIITTVAGNGTAGYSGDGGVATSAELNSPTAVAFDAAGNMYIADTIGERIRKVAFATGIITTIAGTGTQGYSGDGGVATSAELSYPEAVTLDASGNIYFADSRNQRIRKVTVSTGIITTVAGDGTGGYSGDGGAATSAELDDPYGMTLDASGNIYIADYANNRVRKVTVSTGIITTVAGDGTAGYTGNGGAATSATLNGPETVAIDSAGNLYISDFNNFAVRKVTASTGIITTVAGDGVTGFSGDDGPATSAEIAGAGGLAVDSAFDLYISDTLNNRVRLVAGNVKLAITSVSPSIGAIGSTVTINGTGFGSTQGTVTFNGIAAAVSSWSATSITVTVPAGATTGNIVVTAGGVGSNGVIFIVIPVIGSISPASAILGTSVTITGTGFGTTQGTGTVAFNGVNATPSSWSATSIVAPAPTSASTGNVVVSASGVKSNGVAFTAIPHITGISPASAAAGALVTITGTAFGATQGAGTVTFNGIAATPTSWSATSIVAHVPAGAATGSVVVNASGVNSNGLSFADLPAPTLTGIAPVSGGVGTVVTITGTNFGAAQGTGQVTFNGVVATPTSWTATSIVVPVPNGATTGNVIVQASGVPTAGILFTVIPPPVVVSGWGPTQGPAATATTPGMGVTLKGANFGAAQGTSTVQLCNAAPCTADNSVIMPLVPVAGAWSNATILVQVPVNAATGVIVITVGNQSSSPVNFTVTAPFGCPAN
jgi:hypothetical protein